MRNAHPLLRDLAVHLDCLAVVQPVEVIVHGAEILLRQALPLLGHAVRLVLKLGEHRLAEHRRAEVLEHRADQRDLRLAVARVLVHQVLVEQNLVAGRGDLRHEDRIIRLGKRLRFARVVAVHRVAHLVAQRGEAVVRPRVVEQHIRRGLVHGVAVCAAALVLRLVHVNPAVGKRVGRIGDVVFAQRLHRLQERLKRLVDIHLHVKAVARLRVQVVHVQLRNTQLLLSDAQVFAECGQAAVHRVDQAVIDALVDLIGIQRRLARAPVAARGACKDVRLHLSGVEAGDGIAHLAVAVHHLGVRGLAHGAVRALQEGHQPGVGQQGLFAVLAARGAQVEVRVRQHVVRVLRHAGHLGGHRQQLLLARGERVRLHAQHALEEHVVRRKRRIGDHARQLAFLERQQLRREERGLCAHLAVKRLRTAVHRLVDAHGRVLVLLHHRVAVDVAHLFHQRHVALERLFHRFTALLQRAGAGGKCVRFRLHGFKRLLPGLVAFVNARQVPGVAGIDRRAGELVVHEYPSFRVEISFLRKPHPSCLRHATFPIGEGMFLGRLHDPCLPLWGRCRAQRGG